MPIIRRLLTPSTVYPTNLRYNEVTDTVQSNVNGTWVDNPEADPRNQTSFPPRLTSDPTCDAAQSVVDALIGQIDGIVEAIDNASTLFTIAGIILSIFTFGAYAIFISLALGIGNQMVGFGSAAITAALTPAVYDTLKCILFCHMTAQGRLNTGELGAVTGEVTDQIGGIGAIILNAMLNLAGEGGINNLASLGTSTGSCGGCACCDCTDAANPVRFITGAVLSVTQNSNCTVTFRVESRPDGPGAPEAVIWGDRSAPSTDCFTFEGAQLISGGGGCALVNGHIACNSAPPMQLTSAGLGQCVQALQYYPEPCYFDRFVIDITIGCLTGCT